MTISSPGDRAEKEAVRVAEKVVQKEKSDRPVEMGTSDHFTLENFYRREHVDADVL